MTSFWYLIWFLLAFGFLIAEILKPVETYIAISLAALVITFKVLTFGASPVFDLILFVASSIGIIRLLDDLSEWEKK